MLSFRTALPVAALLILAACSGKQAEPVPENETTVEPLNDSAFENVDEPEAAPPPVLNETNTARALPPPEVPDEQQIQEDAEASGMTARLPDSGGDNATQPAQ